MRINKLIVMKTLFLLISLTVLYSCNLADIPSPLSTGNDTNTASSASVSIIGKWRITDTEDTAFVCEYKTDGSFEQGKDPEGIYTPINKGSYSLSGNILTITTVSTYYAGKWNYYSTAQTGNSKILLSANRMTGVMDINNDGIYDNETDMSFAYNRI